MVKIKEFQIEATEFDCALCGTHHQSGHKVKKCVSNSFTDWPYVRGDYICQECARLLSLYFYSYSVEDGEIHLFNVREIRENLLRPHKPPFRFIITKSRKKHLFYKSPVNLSDDIFGVQLELETIFTTRERQRMLFLFVESLMTLGQGKEQMLAGELKYEVLQKAGYKALIFLHDELATSREIQIPLYCGQKLQIQEDEALCNLDSILRA